jgi:3-deoxy-manno-octulosonate cytidylyltransferase (CMP-KDO synthetase)
MSEGFAVIIPARMASTRLPRKPLADLGGVPMVVRVAERAMRSRAERVVVATDDWEIAAACDAHRVQSVMTHHDHPSGSDRLAEACELIGLDGDQRVVNVQGDEPLIEPSLIDACAELLNQQPDCAVGTVAHAITSVEDFRNPNVVKVVLDAHHRAMYFSRAPIPWWRDGSQAGQAALAGMSHGGSSDRGALRHVGIYAYRAGFLRRFPTLAPSPHERIEALEQLRILWHGERIAVHVSESAPAAGVDTIDDLLRVQAHFARA